MDILTANDIARMLKVSVGTVSRWCREAEIPAYRVKGAWRVNRAEFDAWMEKNRNISASEAADV